MNDKYKSNLCIIDISIFTKCIAIISAEEQPMFKIFLTNAYSLKQKASNHSQ